MRTERQSIHKVAEINDDETDSIDKVSVRHTRGGGVAFGRQGGGDSY